MNTPTDFTSNNEFIEYCKYLDDIEQYTITEVEAFKALTYKNLYKDISQICFITITLKPSLYKYSSNTQLELTISHLKVILDRLGEYVFVIELTNAGNIHYHILLKATKINRLCAFNRIKKNKLFGFMSSKMINSDKHLRDEINYICKDINSTSKVLNQGIVKYKILYSYFKKYYI